MNFQELIDDAVIRCQSARSLSVHLGVPQDKVKEIEKWLEESDEWTKCKLGYKSGKIIYMNYIGLMRYKPRISLEG
jgi:hypothetical protein